VGTPDHIPKFILGKHSFGLPRRKDPPSPTQSSASAKRDPPTKSGDRTFRGKPKNFLEFSTWVIDDPARTRRVGMLLGALISTTAGCVAGIVYVIQLRPERWVYVAAVAASVIAIAQRGQLKKYAGQLQSLATMGGGKSPDPDPED